MHVSTPCFSCSPLTIEATPAFYDVWNDVAGAGLWILGNFAYYVQCWFAKGDIKQWKQRREYEAKEALSTRDYKVWFDTDADESAF